MYMGLNKRVERWRKSESEGRKGTRKSQKKAFKIGVVIGRGYLLRFGRQQASDHKPKTIIAADDFNRSQLSQKDKDGLSGS